MLTLAYTVALLLEMALAAPARHECIAFDAKGQVVEFPPPQPVVRVKGRICGKAVMDGDEQADLDFAPLWLVRNEDQVVASATVGRAATGGTFSFPAVPPGMYRIIWQPGFGRTTEIEVQASNDESCSMPLYVSFHIVNECDWYSGVSLQRTGQR